MTKLHSPDDTHGSSGDIVLVPTETDFHEWIASGSPICRAIETQGLAFRWRSLIYLAPVTAPRTHPRPFPSSPVVSSRASLIGIDEQGVIREVTEAHACEASPYIDWQCLAEGPCWTGQLMRLASEMMPADVPPWSVRFNPEQPMLPALNPRLNSYKTSAHHLNGSEVRQGSLSTWFASLLQKHLNHSIVRSLHQALGEHNSELLAWITAPDGDMPARFVAACRFPFIFLVLSEASQENQQLLATLGGVIDSGQDAELWLSSALNCTRQTLQRVGTLPCSRVFMPLGWGASVSELRGLLRFVGALFDAETDVTMAGVVVPPDSVSEWKNLFGVALVCHAAEDAYRFHFPCIAPPPDSPAFNDTLSAQWRQKGWPATLRRIALCLSEEKHPEKWRRLLRTEFGGLDFASTAEALRAFIGGKTRVRKADAVEVSASMALPDTLRLQGIQGYGALSGAHPFLRRSQ